MYRFPASGSSPERFARGGVAMEDRRPPPPLASLCPKAAPNTSIVVHWSLASNPHRRFAPTTGRAQSPLAATLDPRLRSTRLLCHPALLQCFVDCALTRDRAKPSIIEPLIISGMKSATDSDLISATVEVACSLGRNFPHSRPGRNDATIFVFLGDPMRVTHLHDSHCYWTPIWISVRGCSSRRFAKVQAIWPT